MELLKLIKKLNFTDESLKIEFDIKMGVQGSMPSGMITIFWIKR